MQIFEHVQNIDSISYFTAPKGALRPSVIGEGEERIELIVNGEVMFDDGQEDLPRKCGWIFWHMGGDNTVYRNVIEHPYECMVFHFTVDPYTERRMPRMSFWPDPRSVREFVWSAFRAYNGHPDNPQRPELLAWVYSTLYWHAINGMPKSGRDEVPVVLTKLLEFVESRLWQDLQISDLTDHAEISAPYLYRLFRKHYNISPHRYILSRKLNRACNLLVSTSQQVKSIAADCGMENPETFCRAFRKEYGMTPLEFRKSGGNMVDTP